MSYWQGYVNDFSLKKIKQKLMGLISCLIIYVLSA